MVLLKNNNKKRYIYRIKTFFNPNDFINNIYNNVTLLSYLNSNNYYEKHLSHFSFHRYDYLIGCMNKPDPKRLINNTNQLDFFLKNKTDWLFGYLAYDLKNDLSTLRENNYKADNSQNISFFIPDWVIYKNKSGVFIESLEPLDNHFTETFNNQTNNRPELQSIHLQSQISKETYINTVKEIQHHIKKGDIYELNFCQNFRANNISINPFLTFLKLTEVSPTPFSCFYKENNHFLISASPERYLVKRSNKLTSQPIKGTSKRDDKKDIKEQVNLLKEDTKEKSENLMIVDLVRNDLSQISKKGSVKVDELMGVYPFSHIWQMISTISCQLENKIQFSDILKSSFPMGSMTGAPKIRAMNLIDQFESFKRGLFSGSVGYFSPNGDFDFNVVIRSVLFDQTYKTLSVPVGSAITILSNPESEYNECLLKINSIRSILSSV